MRRIGIQADSGVGDDADLLGGHCTVSVNEVENQILVSLDNSLYFLARPSIFYFFSCPVPSLTVYLNSRGGTAYYLLERRVRRVV